MAFPGVAAAIVAAAALIENREKIYRRTRRDAFEMLDREFLLQYRMRKDDVRVLCDDLRPLLQKERVNQYVVTVEQEVLATLLFYGSGSFQRVVAANYENGMSQPSISRAIDRVTRAINESKQHLIVFPLQEDNIQNIKMSFLRWCKLPNILGAVDCTHINIIEPKANGIEYLDRKGNYSINIQLVCDNDTRIMDAVVKWPGCVHDSFIWCNSGLYHRFQGGGMPIGYLLGENGCGLQPWFVTPILNPSTPQELEFNKRHKRGRNIIERVNGILKSRFRCLDTTGGALCYQPEKVVAITFAFCILHNFCLERKVPLPVPAIQLDATIQRVADEHRETLETIALAQDGNNYLQRGRQLRQSLVDLCV